MDNSPKHIEETLLDEARLSVLEELSLIQYGPKQSELIYDRITKLTSHITNTRIGFLSMVASDYQFFKSHVGLPDPLNTTRVIPLSHSICKHVVATGKPLIVKDTRKVHFLKSNAAVAEFGVVGYLGMPIPINMRGGECTLGSLCALDVTPRSWTPLEVDTVQALAKLITTEIDYRARSYINARYIKPMMLLHQRINNLLTN